jgi:hypothetical protein
VLHRPGDPVRCPDQNHIEPAAAGVGHHGIETGPAGTSRRGAAAFHLHTSGPPNSKVGGPNRARQERPRAGRGRLTVTMNEPSTALEKHFSPAELGERWGLSAGTIRTLFDKEPGVLCIDRPERCHKRGYRSLRIPASVAEKVHQRLVA